VLPPNIYKSGLALLDETLLRLVEIKAAYTALFNLHQQTVRIFSALVSLNNAEVDRILSEAQIVVTDENGRQIFPRSGPAPQTPTIIYSGVN
jgi:hypothetical protein